MSSPEQIFASAQPTADLVRDAMKAAAYTKGLKIRDAIPVDQLLLALLEHAVGDEGRRHTACVVLAAQGDKDQMVEAAQVWLDHLLFPFKAAALHRTAGASGEETPSDDGCNATSYKKPLHNDIEVIHKLAEKREGHSCVASGQCKPGAPTLPIVATSILPSMLHAFNHGNNHETARQLSPQSWEVIRKWGSLDARHLIAGPTNTIVLRTDLVYTFKHFLWWFQTTDEPNTYRIMTQLEHFPLPNKRVTFADHSNSAIPPPDPRIFKLHAALARVLFASNAGDYFDSVWSSAINSGVLNTDGSSDIGALLSALAL